MREGEGWLGKVEFLPRQLFGSPSEALRTLRVMLWQEVVYFFSIFNSTSWQCCQILQVDEP